MRELPFELVLPAGAVPEAQPESPAAPRDAATVMLVRDAGAGMEVFLQRRVSGMPFAGGMTVFPGGSVDQRDVDATVAWHGPDADWWAHRFGCSPALARALVCAAVRETFEESGVLLAGTAAGSVVADARPYRAARAALVAREVSFAGFLADAGLVLRADLLRPWANWVTPVQEPRRFDTRFFLAALPTGQHADGDTTEADRTHWQRPADALDDWRRGQCALMAPTWVMLSDLTEQPDVATAMAANPDVDKILPKIVRDGDVLRVMLPD